MAAKDKMETRIDDKKIKDLLKQAIFEALEEKRDIFHELMAEVLEDFAMVRAIQEGEDSDSVSRSDIFRILEGKEQTVWKRISGKALPETYADEEMTLISLTKYAELLRMWRGLKRHPKSETAESFKVKVVIIESDLGTTA